MSEKEIMPDGPESSAGDDFHILWVIRKSMDLFNFKPDGLKAITVEGSAQKDAKLIDPEGDLLLGIDLGEYFGGEDFTGANKMSFTQLKYSTRRPNIPWTISKICQGKKTAYAGSIIHRLASIFLAHQSKFGEPQVREKLTLKLVSNRPVSNDVLDLIEAVQESINEKGVAITFAILKKSVDVVHHSGLERIKSASALSADKVAAFISLLDFSGCGTGSRNILKEEIIWAINKINAASEEESYNKLHVEAWNKMMPESRPLNKLTIIDMLKFLKVGTIRQLFPVPEVFEPHDNLVERVQVQDIITNLREVSDRPVCLHSGAGMGKSSVIHLIKDKLPEGSAVVFFDCYGGGSYLDPDDSRHKADWAVRQIANQMAQEIGSAFFLLPPGQPQEIYYRELRLRLATAIKILRETRPDSLLVLVIDAADNSITAAAQKAERSFVLDIVKLQLPEGCRIMLTTRSYRLNSLDLPLHIPIELAPFEIEETAARLIKIFPDITPEQALEFHLLTGGVPRVQTYALVKYTLGIESVLEPLRPGGKVLDELMEVNIAFVKKKIGDPVLVDRILSFLIAMPRPVSLSALAELAGVPVAIVTDLVTDIGPGIQPSGSLLSLTDEDFEDFLRRTYPTSDSVISAIADHLMKHAALDVYASKHIGNFLRLTGRYDTLKDIVFNGEYLSILQDPVVIKEVIVQRTRAAMALSLSENNPVDFLKLQVVAAEAAKTDELLEQILLGNADLLASYADTPTIDKLLIGDRLTWYAPFHYRCAAVYSRQAETLSLAREHFSKAQSWMQWRDRQEYYDAHRCSMSQEDFIFAAEATCRLADIRTGLNLLFRYNYEQFTVISRRFLIHLLTTGPVEKVNQEIQEKDWRVRVKINVTRAYYQTGRKSPIDIEPLLTRLLAGFSRKGLLREPGKEALFELGEYLSWQRNDAIKIKQLLSYITLTAPQQFPHFYASNFREDEALAKLDFQFKTRCLSAAWADQSVTIADFYTDEFKAVKTSQYSPYDRVREERQRADILFAMLLPLFMARAKFLTGKLSENDLMLVFKGFPNTLHRNYETYRYHREMQYFLLHYGTVFSDLILYVQNKAAFSQLVLQGFSNSDNTILLNLVVAEMLSRKEPGHPAALSILNQGSKLIFDAETGAAVKIEQLLRCVRIGTRLDPGVGKAYFKQTIDTIGEMDLEGFDQIRFVSGLAESLKGRHPKTAFSFSEFTQFAYSRLRDWDHFPWHESITGIGALDHFGVWATIARWDHLGLINLDDYLLSSCRSALRKDLIDPATHASLLVLAGAYPDEFTEQLALLVAKVAPLGQSAVNAVGSLFYRLIRFEVEQYRQKEMLTVLARALDKAECTDSMLIRYISEYISLKNDKSEKSPVTDNHGIRVDYGLTIPVLNWQYPEKIRTLIKETADKTGRSCFDVLVAMRATCSISHYLNFLDLLAELDDEVMSYHDRDRLLEDTLILWQDHPNIYDWKNSNFFPYFQRIFAFFTETRDILNTPSLTHVAALFGANEDRLADATKAILSQNIDRLDAGVIYKLGKFTKTGISEQDLVGVIDWALQRWSVKIPSNWNSSDWDDKFLVDDDQKVAAAGLLRYVLGHHRKSIRWRALHGLRLAAKIGDVSVLSQLLASQDKLQVMPFQHQPYTWYWMSAKLWLWILMKKLADEEIQGIVEFSKETFNTLSDESIPHSLIRYHAQRVALIIEALSPGAFSASEVKTLETVMLPGKNAKTITGVKSASLGLDSLSFPFDTTDTVPYWYQPLCHVFDVPYLTVANRADILITKEWKYNSSSMKDDFKVADRNYNSTTNGHGDIPAIETVQHYFEFHSMFFVASQLLDEAAAETDAGEAFIEWLEHWNTTFGNLWLSDLRDITPADKVFNLSKRPENWRKMIAEDYINSFLQKGDDWVTISANVSLIYGSENETIRVSSALVSESNGKSLLPALQDMPMHYYRLPEEDEDDHEINHGKFILKGWYRSVSGRNKVHDGLDPIANQLQQSYNRPGKEFMTWGKFELSSDFRITCRSGGENITEFENWDDSTENPDSRQHESRGQRFSIMKTELLSFLRDNKYSLIIEVKIDRDETRHYYYDDDKRLNLEIKNIYLLEQDGTVKTTGRDFKLR